MFDNMGNTVCLVTGASSEIGKGVAKAMAQMGVKVIMVSRDKTRGKEAFEEIRNISNNNVDWIPADLCSIKSIHKLALSFKSKNSKLDILFNCAGDKIMNKYNTIDGSDGLFEVKSSEESYDNSVATKLWEESEKLLDLQDGLV